MYVLYGDETNTEPAGDVEFFIYGALILSEEQIVEVHRGIADIREDLGLQHDEPLKFSYKPKRISPEDHKEAKRKTIELLHDTEASFVAYCVHHQIAKGKSVEERNEYALNTVLWGFKRFLDEKPDHGLVVLDHLTPEHRLVLGHLNSEGLKMYDGQTVPMPRITGVATAHVEWNHGLSACDVLLGAFRYCVNKPDHSASKAMFPSVAELLWYWTDEEGTRQVRERGLLLRPLEVKSPAIRARYDALIETLQQLTPGD